MKYKCYCGCGDKLETERINSELTEVDITIHYTTIKLRVIKALQILLKGVYSDGIYIEEDIK